MDVSILDGSAGYRLRSCVARSIVRERDEAGLQSDLEIGMLRPGIRVRTSPNDYQPMKQLFLIRFSGKDWEPFGPVVGD